MKYTRLKTYRMFTPDKSFSCVSLVRTQHNVSLFDAVPYIAIFLEPSKDLTTNPHVWKDLNPCLIKKNLH